jgi:hypothetical protein
MQKAKNLFSIQLLKINVPYEIYIFDVKSPHFDEINNMDIYLKSNNEKEITVEECFCFSQRKEEIKFKKKRKRNKNIKTVADRKIKKRKIMQTKQSMQIKKVENLVK